MGPAMMPDDFLQSSDSSEDAFRLLDKHQSVLQLSFRRSLVASMLGDLLINLALAVLLSPSWLNVRTTNDAVVMGLIASIVLAGSGLAHNAMLGKTMGLALLDQAYNMVLMPLSAVSLLLLQTYF